MSEDELTIDQLAARVGMTVRNLRAYAGRGLLPAPRLVGRTGYYGPQHVAQLTLVRELLGQGYTLAAVQKAVARRGAGQGEDTGGALALHRALMAPWQTEPPQETDLDALAARAGADREATEEVAQELARMGVLELLPGGQVRVLDPALLDAGIRGVRLGLPASALVAAQQRVVELVEEAAETYVGMFRDTVWREFLDAGMPEDQWPRIQAVVEGLQPVAAQALLASFRSAMAAAVAQEVDADVALSRRRSD